MSDDITGCIFVSHRQARSVVTKALKASGVRGTYLSRAESGGTARFVTSGTRAQLDVLYAILSHLSHADVDGIEAYCEG